jgi:predicted Zn-dependent protease
VKVYCHILFFISLMVLGGEKPLQAANHLPQEVFLRDAEIEQALKDFTIPLFKVAGLDPTQLKVFIFNSTEVNAAAGLQYSILINTGLILKANNVGELIGVIAHETGHLAGRHNEQLMNVGYQPLIPMLGALLIGGVAAAASGDGAPLAAGLMGGMEMSQNTVLAYHRTHENSADHSAIQYLEKLGWPSIGFKTFLDILHKQDMLSMERQYAYKRTHPFTIDRLKLLERHCERSKFTQSCYPAGFETKFNRIRAKISAYVDPPNVLFQRYPLSDTSLLARYSRAIAYHQTNQTAKALDEINHLLADHPKDPYFLEFKGQILFETGQIDQAISSYRQAVQHLPQSALLKIQLAHMLLESRGTDKSNEVISLLDKARDVEADSPSLWRLYATAYGRQNQEGMVALMLAEEAVQLGKMEDAQTLADKAIKLLPTSKRTHIQRAKDIKSLEVEDKPSEMM